MSVGVGVRDLRSRRSMCYTGPRGSRDVQRGGQSLVGEVTVGTQLRFGTRGSGVASSFPISSESRRRGSVRQCDRDIRWVNRVRFRSVPSYENPCARPLETEVEDAMDG